jgi:hypothetical protein
MHTVAPPLKPSASLRDRIVNLRREIAGLKSGSGSQRWVAQAEQELTVLEAELASMERSRP